MKVINIGDLITFKPGTQKGGSLSSVKYFARMEKRIGHCKHGIVVGDHGKTVSAIFGHEIIILSKDHIEAIKNG